MRAKTQKKLKRLEKLMAGGMELNAALKKLKWTPYLYRQAVSRPGANLPAVIAKTAQPYQRIRVEIPKEERQQQHDDVKVVILKGKGSSIEAIARALGGVL